MLTFGAGSRNVDSEMDVISLFQPRAVGSDSDSHGKRTVLLFDHRTRSRCTQGRLYPSFIHSWILDISNCITAAILLGLDEATAQLRVPLNKGLLVIF